MFFKKLIKTTVPQVTIAKPKYILESFIIKASSIGKPNKKYTMKIIKKNKE